MSVAVPSARRDEIVAAARQILESEGPSHLTMRSLAERLEIRAPSLYKHVADKDELEALLIAEALRGMGEALHAALEELPLARPKKRALATLARAYRTWALAHPHLYCLATEGELPRDICPRARGMDRRAAPAGDGRSGSRARRVGVCARDDDP